MCGAVQVVTNMTAAVEKVANVAGKGVSHAWDGAFASVWNGLHSHLGKPGAQMTAHTVEDLMGQLSQLREASGQVQLETMLLDGARGLLTFDKFERFMRPLAFALGASSGVMYYLGEWIGGLVQPILHLTGLDTGKLEEGDLKAPSVDGSDDMVENAINNAKAALEDVSANAGKEDLSLTSLHDLDFEKLCLMVAQAQTTLQKKTSPLSRNDACPDADNEFLHMVKPNEISSPAFEEVDIDIAPLW